MKVAIWLNEDYKPEEGGGHSYYDKLIKGIDRTEIDSRLEFVFLSTKKHGNFNKPLIVLKPFTRLQLFSRKALKFIPGTKLRSSFQQRAFREKYKTLIAAGIDIIYYPVQAQQTIPDFPFISTNWDLGHLSTFPFPEFTQAGEFRERERWYREYLPQALLIFAESETGKAELIKHLQLSADRIKIVPLFAGDFPSVSTKTEVLVRKYSLEPEQYFFYPAQFWAHKNHYALVKAFSQISSTHPHFKLALTGSDKGNLAYIRELVASQGLSEKVVFPGFVSNEEMAALYHHAAALVMPTFLGPTNMPLLEALHANCPIICSDLEGHREMVQDAALYFSPSDHATLATHLGNIARSGKPKMTQENSARILATSPFNIATAIHRIQAHLLELIPIRKTWK
ncbi:MAG: glycosyltransferase [Chitinophagaceae bacterium]